MEDPQRVEEFAFCVGKEGQRYSQVIAEGSACFGRIDANREDRDASINNLLVVLFELN